MKTLRSILLIGLGLGLSGCASTNYRQEKIMPDKNFAIPIPFVENNVPDRENYRILTEDEMLTVNNYKFSQ